MAKQTDDRQTTSNAGFFVGLLVGTLIGAALGVLLAPKPGTQLRSDVRDAAERGAEAFRRARAVRYPDPEPEKEN
jgi:gas vesicle protein